MTPLFWIALTWVLITVAVMRLPVNQRFLPGALLMVTALPIVISMGFHVGWLFAILGLVALFSLFPNPVRLAMARYRGENVQLDATVLRYMVVPGDL